MKFLKSKLIFSIFFMAWLCSLAAEDEDNDIVKSVFAEGISIDLCEPTFSNGVFTTDKGGVIIAPQLRIQARKLTYTKRLVDKEPVFKLEAEGDLMVEFGDYIFVGDRLVYDFQSKQGTIINSRTEAEPWFVGGSVIRLLADGSYFVEHGFITTDENLCPDWKISTFKARLCQERYLRAEDVRFKYNGLLLFWLPVLRMDLETIFDSPFHYNFKWGGREGPRVSMSYEIVSFERFKTFLRFDYRFNRGPGGGIETFYRSADHKEFLQTINFIARDNSIFISDERLRYRLEGVYSRLLCDDTVSIDLTYDKLSDKYMATDYDDQGIELETAGRTQLDINKQNPDWIANLYARVRVNSFETVKQELPTFLNSWRPFSLGPTGVIFENQYKLSYLNFDYADHLPGIHDFAAGRLAFWNNLYRPIPFKYFTITPEAGLNAIFYSNGPHGEDDKWLAQGVFGCEAVAPFYRNYFTQKHVIEPYLSYYYYTAPTISPHQHYIFDIDDGWVRLNMLTFGASNSLYKKDSDGNISRYLFVDVYANAFFNVHTFPATVPKVYVDTVWRPNEFLKYTVDSAWDFEENQLDHVNVRSEWTVNADLALAAEYRHRSSFCWRKADPWNFMLDAFHSLETLRHSTVSDRRSTFLMNMFYRFLPNWALEVESRHGWDRHHEKSYTEFEIDLLTTVYSAGQVKLSYQHIEGDDRIAIYFSLGLKRPDSCDECIVPFLEF